MSDHQQETISALMDNEVSELELRSLLKRLPEDQKSGEKWQRYHLASSVLKQDESPVVMDISSSVMAALDDEPTYTMKPGEDSSRTRTIGWREYLLKPVASMAMAASVTAVVILGAQQYGAAPADEGLAQSTPNTGFILPNTPVSADVLPAQYGDRTATTAEGEPDVIRLNQSLTKYIKQHETLVAADASSWQPGWVPEGYSPVKNGRTSTAEVAVFSNGKNAFTVCVEELKQQASLEGVTRVGDVVAVGKAQDDRFITVVGDVPLTVADRIANSVKAKD